MQPHDQPITVWALAAIIAIALLVAAVIGLILKNRQP